MGHYQPQISALIQNFKNQLKFIKYATFEHFQADNFKTNLCNSYFNSTDDQVNILIIQILIINEHTPLRVNKRHCPWIMIVIKIMM